jgi:hypothetical protein
LVSSPQRNTTKARVRQAAKAATGTRSPVCEVKACERTPAMTQKVQRRQLRCWTCLLAKYHAGVPAAVESQCRHESSLQTGS